MLVLHVLTRIGRGAITRIGRGAPRCTSIKFFQNILDKLLALFDPSRLFLASNGSPCTALEFAVELLEQLMTMD